MVEHHTDPAQGDGSAPAGALWSRRVRESDGENPHARADALLLQAEPIKRRDYDRVQQLAEEAFELSCQAGPDGAQYRQGMAAALALLAHLSTVRGESETALQQASQALTFLDTRDPSALLGNLYLTMGWAHYQLGDYVDALDELVTARHIAEQVDDQVLMAYVMDRTANVYHATARAELALDLQSRALQMFHENGDTMGEALLRNNMSYTLIDLGRYDEALESAMSALAWIENEGSMYLLMGTLDTVAHVHLRRGELEEAAEYSARSHALAHEHHSEPDRGDALLTMANIEMARGHYDEALSATEEALSIAEKHGRSIEEYTCHEMLSRIQEKRGDIESALAHHRRYHELERQRINDETSSRLANLQVEHEVDTARKDAEIHRLRSLALEREVEQRRIAQTQLEAQASLDPLTGLFNRRHVSVLAQELERDLAHGRQASVLLFDLDHFKDINDTFGHFAGDHVLVSIARLLRENARDADTPVRYGGDEFLMLLTGTGPEKARGIAERIRAAIAATPVNHRNHQIMLTASMGVASARPDDPVGLVSLVERADRALYSAKRAGRNCVVADVS